MLVNISLIIHLLCNTQGVQIHAPYKKSHYSSHKILSIILVEVEGAEPCVMEEGVGLISLSGGKVEDAPCCAEGEAGLHDCSEDCYLQVRKKSGKFVPMYNK